MLVTLPADIEKSLAPEEASLGMAIGLYATGKLGFGRAAEAAGLSRPAFQAALARLRIPLDYSLQDLADDAAALETLPA